MSINREDTTDYRLIGALFKAGSLALLIICVAMGTDIIDQVNSDISAQNHDSISMLEAVVVAVALFFSIVFYKIGRSLNVRSAEEIRMQDPRPPVLFLRSFKNDAANTALVNDSFTAETFEESLIKRFDRIGPFIGIGKPEDKRRPPGVARVYTEFAMPPGLTPGHHDSHHESLKKFLIECESSGYRPEKWQSVLGRLVNQAALVLISYDSTPGTQWEVEHVIKYKEPQSVLFLFRTPQRWQAFQVRYPQIYGYDIASLPDHLQYLGFSHEGRPEVIAVYPEMNDPHHIESDFTPVMPPVDYSKLERHIKKRAIKRPFSFKRLAQNFFLC